MHMPPALRGARAAFVFLTRLPAGGFPYTREDWAWASAHFPLAGAAVGGMAASAYWLSASAGPLAAAALAVTTAVLTTGALHEDALADTADALGGARDRAHVFVILKDPRVGAYGAVAIAVSLLLRSTLIAAVDSRAPALLVAIHCAARAVPVWLLSALTYVTPEATAKSTGVAQAGARQSILASLWMLCVLALTTSGLELAAIAGVALAVAMACGVRFQQRVGGVTGDLAGSTVVLSECAMWLAVALLP
jgi:adenosylcobinamide-GDP ribazoletransferase